MLRRFTVSRASGSAAFGRVPKRFATPNHAYRLYSNGQAPKKNRGILRGLLKVGAVAIAIPVGYLATFFIYDYTTYKDGPLEIQCDIPIGALDLRRGGPKNLPIAEAWIDDNELEHDSDRPHLVIVGSGWGAIACMRNIDTKKYNVTMVSPTNHFLFTPLLPSAAVGTLSLESLMEPVRDLCRKRHVRFIAAAADDIHLEDRLLEVRSDSPTNDSVHFYIPYDEIVFATGAKSNTHGVPGLENTFPFKTALDAQEVKEAICRNLEMAALPSTSEEERKRLLSFVVCGGGPTGVEVAAEIYDLLREDVIQRFPTLLLNNSSVHIIQSRSSILNTYDEKISDFAMQRFARDGIDLQVNSRVEEVRPGSVLYSQRLPDGTKQIFELPSGLTLWTTGITTTRFTQKVSKMLSEFQHNKRALETDSYCRVIGAPPGVYAIGDCATIRTDLVADLKNIMVKHAKKRHGTSSGYIDTLTVQQAVSIIDRMVAEEPQAGHILKTMRERLLHDRRPDESLNYDQVIKALQDANAKVVSLPATAQRAHQQGEYIAQKLNSLGGNLEDHLFKPFAFKNLGSMAYVSNGAIIDTGRFQFLGGVLAMYAWRSAYMSMTVTPRARLHMAFDWMYRGLFGRQIYLHDRQK